MQHITGIYNCKKQQSSQHRYHQSKIINLYTPVVAGTIKMTGFKIDDNMRMNLYYYLLHFFNNQQKTTFRCQIQLKIF